MTDSSIKLRHIAPTYLKLSLTSILALAFIRWICTIQYDIVHLKLEAWHLFAPAIVAVLSLFIGLWPKLALLTFEGDHSKGRQVIIWIAVATLFGTLTLSQRYLTNLDTQVRVVETVEEIPVKPESAYYSIRQYHVAQVYAHAEDISVNTPGRRSIRDETITITNYFVVPVTAADESKPVADYKYWFGVRFQKTAKYRDDTRAMDQVARNFREECLVDLDRYNFKAAKYFELLGDSHERDHFLEGIYTAAANEIPGDVAILIPRFNRLDPHDYAMLYWSLAVFVIGTAACYVALAFAGHDTIVLERFEKKRARKRGRA